MIISPSSQEFEKKLKFPAAVQRKRKLSDIETSGYESIKQSLLDNEEEKLRLLKQMDSKLDRLVTIFERVAEDQSKMLAWMVHNQTTQYPLLPPPFPSTNFHPPTQAYLPQDEYHK